MYEISKKALIVKHYLRNNTTIGRWLTQYADVHIILIVNRYILSTFNTNDP